MDKKKLKAKEETENFTRLYTSIRSKRSVMRTCEKLFRLLACVHCAHIHTHGLMLK